MKRTLAMLWNNLPPAERIAFLNCLDWDGDRHFEPPKGFRADPLEQALRDWPRVLMRAEGKARSIALSIQKQRKKAGWTPSEKQAAFILRLWKETRDEAGGEVVE